MDQIKTGKFIAGLRREKGITQEELGSRLGVTNKTVSRWENGNYMPDVETLRLLSKEFGVSMEELLDGERVGAQSAPKEPRPDRFTREERVAFWKRNWKRENRSTVVFFDAVLGTALILSIVFGKYVLTSVFSLLVSAAQVIFYNKMMAYVERNAHKMKE